MITLGIDCGTQSTKTIALDADTGKVLARSSLNYGLISGLPSGHMEQEPALWVKALESTVENVISSLGQRKNEIRAFGVSGQQHGFIPLDRQGDVIRPAKLWCDTSTADECRILSEAFGGKKGLIEKIGLDMLPGYTAPKILWLKRNEPENFRRLAHILLPHDYLNYYLTDKLAMEFGDASGTALLDVKNRTWLQEICDFIDPSVLDALPPLKSSRKPVGVLKSTLAVRWGLSQDVQVSAGGGDNMMGAIGTGNTTPGKVTVSLGTSGTIYAYSMTPIVDPEGEVAAFCDSTDAWLPLLCTMNVTVATERARGMFGWDHSQMEKSISKIRTGSDGLLFLPYLQGERTPNLPDATGVLHGLTTENFTPAHLARATTEGVTLGMAYGLRRMKKLGVNPSEIQLTGGGSQSQVWRQICADVFGAPVVTLTESEGAALGAAIQALSIARPEQTVETWANILVQTQTDSRLDPENGSVKFYQELAEKHTALTRSLARDSFL